MTCCGHWYDRRSGVVTTICHRSAIFARHLQFATGKVYAHKACQKMAIHAPKDCRFQLAFIGFVRIVGKSTLIRFYKTSFEGLFEGPGGVIITGTRAFSGPGNFFNYGLRDALQRKK